MTTITAVAAASLTLPSPWPMTATFVYTDEEPLEVRMTLSLEHDLFSQGQRLNRSITWTFARELLDAAFSDPGVSYGNGDVLVTVGERCLRFGLVGAADVRHEVVIELEPVFDFMVNSFMVVPAYAERLSEQALDNAIERLLGSAS